MGISNYNANKILDAQVRNTTFSYATSYFGLATAPPLDTDTGSSVDEPSTSGTNYARVAYTNNSSGWSAVTNRQRTNLNPFTFDAATASFGTITHIVRFDSATGGNVLDWDVLRNGDGDQITHEVVAGEQLHCAAGNYRISIPASA